MDLAIHTQGLRREFGTFVAVDGIDLDPLREPLAVERRVGVVPEDLALFEQPTAAATLVLSAGAGIARLGWPLAARALDARRENLAMVAQDR